MERKTIYKRIAIYACGVIVVACILFSCLSLWFFAGMNNPQTIDTDINNVVEVLAPLPNDKKAPINVLFLGVDKIGGRSDTMIFASYNPETSKIIFLSIPRDTLVEIPGVSKSTGKQFGVARINEAYSYGGIELAVKTAKQFLGVNINYYVRLSFDGFYEIINTIGGIELEVEHDMSYDDNAGNLHIHLTKGWQVLDADKAIQYLRWRKNNDGTVDPEGDIGRIARQQKFAKVFLKQLLQPANIMPSRIIELRETVANNVNTNCQLTDSIILKMLKEFTTDDLNERIEFVTLYGEHYGNYWRVQEEHAQATQTLLNDFWGISPYNERVTVDLVCYSQEQAELMENQLLKRFPSISINNVTSSEPALASQMKISSAVNADMAKAIAIQAGIYNDIEVFDSNSINADIVIVVSE